MKKGDLVVRSEDRPDIAFGKFRVPEFTLAVVISDPYAAVFTQDLTHSGVGVYSQEKIVVDLLAGNRVINKCPIDLIVRAEHVTTQGEN